MREEYPLTEAKKKRITYLHGKKYPKGTHYCATHVEHHDWGIGQPIHGQHAKPDQYGDIDWYDVMFEHGIEKRVPTDDLHILLGEGHGNENHQWENGEEIHEMRMPEKEKGTGRYKDPGVRSAAERGWRRADLKAGAALRRGDAEGAEGHMKRAGQRLIRSRKPLNTEEVEVNELKMPKGGMQGGLKNPRLTAALLAGGRRGGLIRKQGEKKRMGESFDKLTPAQQRDADRRLKPTRATVAKTRLPATNSEMERHVQKWRDEMRGTTTQRRLRDARLRADRKAKVGESCDCEGADISEAIKVGDTVHLGHGSKGGTGVIGKVVRIKGNDVHIMNDRGDTFKGPLNRATLREGRDPQGSHIVHYRKGKKLDTSLAGLRARRAEYERQAREREAKEKEKEKTDESIEHLDELKSSTLRSYVKKAQDDNQKRAMRQVDMYTTNPMPKREFKKLRKRNRGVARAKAELDIRGVNYESVEHLDEVSPPGFEGTVKAMKKHKEIDNPWALSWYMKNKGYKSHKTKDGKDKK